VPKFIIARFEHGDRQLGGIGPDLNLRGERVETIGQRKLERSGILDCLRRGLEVRRANDLVRENRTHTAGGDEAHAREQEQDNPTNRTWDSARAVVMHQRSWDGDGTAPEFFERRQPGGHVICRLASRWTCRCGTDSQAWGPLLITRRKPSARWSFFARRLATKIKWPRIGSSATVDSVTRAIGCFGTISRWTGAWGWMSWRTMQCSSSCSILAGISRSMIFWKIVLGMAEGLPANHANEHE